MKKTRGSANLAISAGYRQFVEELKSRVAGAHLSAARRINHELIFLYWDLGCGIVEKQKDLGWGESVVEMVAADLRQAFPSMTGFSARNVWDMKRFYLAYSDEALWRQPVAKLIKGGKGAEILPQPAAELVKTKKRRRPVAEFEGGRNWPQAVAKLGEGGDPGPFLPQLVAEIPWGHHRLILNKIGDPVARLWYLRATAHFGWSRNVLLNYLNLLNDKERGPDDPPSIGIILCAEKDDIEVEYALRSKTNPIGVAVYELQSKLPGELKGKLPTAKQLAEVVRVEMEGGK